MMYLPLLLTMFSTVTNSIGLASQCTAIKMEVKSCRTLISVATAVDCSKWPRLQLTIFALHPYAAFFQRLYDVNPTPKENEDRLEAPLPLKLTLFPPKFI